MMKEAFSAAPALSAKALGMTLLLTSLSGCTAVECETGYSTACNGGSRSAVDRDVERKEPRGRESPSGGWDTGGDPNGGGDEDPPDDPEV